MSNLESPNTNVDRKNRRARIAALVSSLPGVMTGGIVAGAAAFEATHAPQALAGEIHNSTEGIAPTAPSGPEGVLSIDTEAQIQAESQDALKHINKRWNGIIVLHTPPTAYANVGFTPAPHAYTQQGINFSEDPYRRKQEIKEGIWNEKVIVEPGYLPDYKGLAKKPRDYFVILDPESHSKYAFYFLDIKWAIQNHAIDFYQVKGSSAKVVKYPLSQVESNPPLAFTDEAHYGPDWQFFKNKPPKLMAIDLPDVSSKHAPYRVEPAKAPGS